MTSSSGSESGSLKPENATFEAPFLVMVDDNYHYMDKDERWRLGAFATLDEAMAACKSLVDACLANYCKPSMDAKELYGQYVMFGDDPFILGPEDPVKFSAWDYAKARAMEICASTIR
jgi:hypothetical protein